MNAVILNERIIKLDSFDPNLLTALAQKARNSGGTFRTSLLPKKRVATLIFSTLPSVSLAQMLEEVTKSETNLIPANHSETLPSDNSSQSSESLSAVQSTATQASEPIAPETETLDPMDNANPSAKPEENTLASLADLLSQRKTKLKKLAQHHKIPGRSSMTHEEKAEALVGFVLVGDL